MSSPASVLPLPIGAPKLKLSRDDLIARGVLLLIVAFLVLFLLAPMAAILVRAVQDNDGRFVGFTHFADTLGSPALLRAAWNSVWVAATVACVSVSKAAAARG